MNRVTLFLKSANRLPSILGQLLLLVVYGGALFLIYTPSFQAPFIFDDQRNLLNDNLMMTELSISSLQKAALNGELSGRPLSNITFALDYYFHGQDLFGYHLVNILIHLVNGFLLFLLALQILNLPALTAVYRSSFLTALFIALLWSVHPLHIQSVTYIVQRMNSLATMFFLAGFVCYLYWRQSYRKWIFACGVLISFLLAMSSKEIAATFPLLIILFDWYFFQDLKLPSKKKLLLFGIATIAAIIVLGYFYIGSNPFASILASFGNRDFTLSQRLLTETRIVVFYLSLLLYPNPNRLNLLHDFSISHSFVDPLATLFATILLVVIICIACLLAKRERLISFCLLWFLINLLIESTVFPLELIFEHRTYLPSVMIVFMLVSLLFRWLHRRNLAVGILLVPFLLFSYWTYERNVTWSDDVLFWEDCLLKSPNSARAHNNLGFALKNKGKYEEAKQYFREALRLQPDLVLAGYNLKMTEALQANNQDPMKAIQLYRDAVRINPHNATAFFNLGVLLSQKGRDQEAIENYRTAIRVKPSFAEAHNNIGSALSRSGDNQQAIFHYRESVRYNPTDAIANYNLGFLLAQQKDYEESKFYLSEAVRLNPAFSRAKQDLEKVRRLSTPR